MSMCECVRLEIFSSKNYYLYKIKIHLDFASVSIFFYYTKNAGNNMGLTGAYRV